MKRGPAGYSSRARLLLWQRRSRARWETPAVVKDMAPYRRWVDPLLREAYRRAEEQNDARKQLHASLALLPIDGTQVAYLEGRLLQAEPHEVPVIGDALAPRKDELLEKLWAVAGAGHRLRFVPGLLVHLRADLVGDVGLVNSLLLAGTGAKGAAGDDQSHCSTEHDFSASNRPRHRMPLVVPALTG